MMKLILKYRNKIVSLGLLPIIATLICLHFFQTSNPQLSSSASFLRLNVLSSLN